MVNFESADTAHAADKAQWPWAVKSYRTRWGDLLSHVLIECAAMSVVVLLILAAGGLAGVYWAVPALNVQSRQFADASVGAIAPRWDESQLFAEATPQLIASSYNGYDSYFASLKRLGGGARNEGCQGHSVINPLALTALVTPRFVRRFLPPPPYSTLVTAQYVCELDTSGGKAVVNLSMRRDDDAWRISRFFVSSPRLVRG